ncbi:hypothetical protein [Thermosipho atlanticus]|uniref:Uncharacterized protein n=1 Tax=Thermosipho atlanticus DSM 15807 TaxID=1123380 RepID=A0A1M5QPM8_9BACT|nr:hypothetical protein [Thermosipho atlanticus]SHH15906.1 hypothetical protein SAMN02745199_0064 [Thermosipho atlanticus DSM 15807]
MKFIDGFNVKYVKKEKKNMLTAIVKKLSEFQENGIKCSLVPNENFGYLRLEIYETENEGELVYFSGFSLTEDLGDWLTKNSEYRTFSEELKITNSLMLDVEVSEIKTEKIKGLIVKNNVIYVLLDKELTFNMSNIEIAKLVIRVLVENVFESMFDEEEYEFEIESELTDFFS